VSTCSPPEVWRGEKLQSRRPIDIWALGCVFSDIAAYIENGEPGPQDFRSKRQNTEPSTAFHDGNNLKVSVLDWLSNLRSQSRIAGDVGLVIFELLVPSPVKRRTALGLGAAFAAVCGAKMAAVRPVTDPHLDSKKRPFILLDSVNQSFGSRKQPA
jgi:hypothetical protein